MPPSDTLENDPLVGNGNSAHYGRPTLIEQTISINFQKDHTFVIGNPDIRHFKIPLMEEM